MKTGPEPHRCTICGNEDLVPDIMPYCTGGDIKKPVHEWMHPQCKASAMARARQEQKGPAK